MHDTTVKKILWGIFIFDFSVRAICCE